MTFLSNFVSNILDDYDIKGVIGRGNFGIVKEAFRRSDNLHVAIKYQEITSDVRGQQLLLRELSVLSTVLHPNCLQLIAFTLSSQAIIVTPFMSHGTLEDALKAQYTKNPKYNAFTPTKKMFSLYAICSAMSYLHSLSILHRDFKPANIFLNDDFEIVIADFGLSRKVQDNVDITMGFVGSPIFMASELFSDEYESVTNAMDVYSFGVTLLLYFSKEITQLDDKPLPITKNFFLRVSKGARPRPPDSMPNEYLELYRQCVDSDPNARPSFQELADMFEKDPKYLLPGVNQEEYFSLVQKLKSENQRILSASASTDSLSSGSVSLSASSSNPLLLSSTRAKSKTKRKRYV